MFVGEAKILLYAPVLPANIRLAWKGMPGDKHSSLLRKSVRSFIEQAHGLSVLRQKREKENEVIRTRVKNQGSLL
jgi:hypothetical protein